MTNKEIDELENIPSAVWKEIGELEYIDRLVEEIVKANNDKLKDNEWVAKLSDFREAAREAIGVG